MKKIAAIVISILWMSSFGFAISDAIWYSSHTATADTTKAICNQTFGSSQPHAVLHGVCVNTGASTSSFSVFNSSASSANPVAVIDSTTKGCQLFDIYLSSGLSYTNSSTADVTIAYSCY